ncbi:glycosyltransferase family 39 protein [Bifidobacterium sp. 82T10]|uniref:Glycosyltransferase family 39 protein n=1 Tax=Bifidobacterium miconis TaxID=2834435 RepID=A0ABS6WFS1_9BIFI|nr:glycosyltransferase family 39 protein [Bifidobacterium miconis]MBW3092590.1 glycosyltransferase family 39 protein [Bifidobacterium miconis]
MITNHETADPYVEHAGRRADDGSAGSAVAIHHLVPVPVLAACCALATTVLSWLMGRDQSLWFDEQYSLILASRPVRELIALTAVDAHPPLYYLLLKAWMPIAGDNVALLRLPNCVCLGLAVFVLVMLMRDLFGDRVATACMPMLMCGGFMLRYGYELRMYSPAMLLAVGGTAMLLRAAGVIEPRGCLQRDMTDGRDDQQDGLHPKDGYCRIVWWAAYAVTVTLGMLTLYLTAFVWLTHAIWLAARSWRIRRLSAWRWLFAYAASVMLFLPWMPALLGQIGGSSVLPPVRRRTNMSGVANAFDIMLLGMTETELPSIISLLVAATMTLIVGIFVAAWLPARQRSVGTLASQQSAEAAWLIVMLFAVPSSLLMIWSAVKELSSGGYGMFSIRYLSVIAPFLYATLALACTVAYRLRGRRAMIVYVAIVAMLAAGTIVYGVRGNHSFDRNDTPGSAALSQQVVCSASRPVVAQDEYTYIDAYWYYRDCPYYYFLDADEVPTRGGYAPLHGSTAQLRTIDDLDAARFTLLSWSTTRNYDKFLDTAARQWTQTGVIKRDANAAITYHR